MKTTAGPYRGFLYDLKVSSGVKIIFAGIIYNAVPAALNRKNLVEFPVGQFQGRCFADVTNGTDLCHKADGSLRIFSAGQDSLP